MKNSNFILRIISTNGTMELNEVEKINFATSEGFITILSNHANLAGIIKNGKCNITNANNEISLFHTNGVFSFIENELKFIVQKYDKNEILPQNIIENNYLNKIIENRYFIDNKFGMKEEMIEFEFKKNIKNII